MNSVNEFQEQVRALAALAKECPEPFREKCFEVLFARWLDRAEAEGTFRMHERMPGSRSDALLPEPDESGELLRDTELHVRGRHFLRRWDVPLSQIRRLFVRDGDRLVERYQDVPVQHPEDKQLCIALLHALRQGLETGNFVFHGEEVRASCARLQCYNPLRFSAIFEEQKRLFEAFAKYDQHAPSVRLSREGEERLAGFVKRWS